jgi:arabinose-5-phosphate isomerase
LIGQKLAATFASTGTPSHFVHPAEAIHGDLGRIQSNDVVLILSYSGTTEEITRILPAIRSQAAGIIAITGSASSVLAKSADVVLLLPPMTEACVNGLAPSTSTTSMLALGDAVAIVVSQLRGFGPHDFARYHPGGSLGRKLSRVDDLMRPLDECRLATTNQTIRQVLIQVSKPGRRTGAIMLVDDLGKLVGIFTDSDLSRLLERRKEAQLDQPISEVMIRRFQAVHSGASVQDAIYVLSNRKISELPVIDQDDRPVGLIDITDVISIVDQKQSSPTIGYEKPVSIRIFGDD